MKKYEKKMEKSFNKNGTKSSTLCVYSMMQLDRSGLKIKFCFTSWDRKVGPRGADSPQPRGSLLSTQTRIKQIF